MASAMLRLRHTSDSYGVIGLALNACDERANGHRSETDQLREVLVGTRDLWELALASRGRRRPPTCTARRPAARAPRERALRDELGLEVVQPGREPRVERAFRVAEDPGGVERRAGGEQELRHRDVVPPGGAVVPGAVGRPAEGCSRLRA